MFLQCVLMVDVVERSVYKPFQSIALRRGQVLEVSRAGSYIAGTRAYIAFQGGVDVPKYLGSRSTFVNGNFGGHQGRLLRAGDMLPIGECGQSDDFAPLQLPESLWPSYSTDNTTATTWVISVLPGPRSCPDYLKTP